MSWQNACIYSWSKDFWHGKKSCSLIDLGHGWFAWKYWFLTYFWHWKNSFKNQVKNIKNKSISIEFQEYWLQSISDAQGTLYYKGFAKIRKVVSSTTSHYKTCTNYFPALLCTTKVSRRFAVLSSTTSHYKTCANYFPALLCTTKVSQRFAKYVPVLLRMHFLPTKKQGFRAIPKIEASPGRSRGGDVTVMSWWLIFFSAIFSVSWSLDF